MQFFRLLLWKNPLFCGRIGGIRPALTFVVAWIFAANYVAFAAQATTVTMAISSGGASVTSVTQGAVVTLTAMVIAGGTPVAPGQVNFCDATAAHCTGIHLLATAQVTSAGTAIFKFRPGAGNHSYKAVFAGTTADAGSSSSASPLIVSAPAKLPTTTTIAQSGINGNYSLTATVYAQGSTPPTGAVWFLDTSNGNEGLGEAPFSAYAGLGFVNASITAVPSGSSTATVAGDFNGDGIPDVVMANSFPVGTTDSVSALLGNGDGTFTATAATNLATEYGLGPLVADDFDQDGILDLAIVTVSDAAGDATVTVLLGNGDGTFRPITPGPAVGRGGQQIAAGDFNGDGIPDLAVEVESSAGDSSSIAILLGNGDGTFTPATGSEVTGEYGSIAAGDFNGDGILDLAVVDNAIISQSPANNNVTILLGNGQGGFTANTLNLQSGNYEFQSIAVGDFNGDGLLDLAVTNQFGPGTVTVLVGDGHGNFASTGENDGVSGATAGESPGAIAVGDFNGDGKADFVVAVNGGATVLLGDGKGDFGAVAIPTIVTASGDFALADFNGDGLTDIAPFVEYGGNGGRGVEALLAANQVATATTTGITLQAGPHLVDASYSGDSNYASSVSGTTYLEVLDLATTLSVSVNPSTIAYNGEVTMTATLSPATNQGVSSNGGTVTFTNANAVNGFLGQAFLSGGVATFTRCCLPVGTYQVQASYPGNPLFAPAISPTVLLTIKPTTPTISLTSSANPALVSTPVTFTANLLSMGWPAR